MLLLLVFLDASFASSFTASFTEESFGGARMEELALTDSFLVVVWISEGLSMKQTFASSFLTSVFMFSFSISTVVKELLLSSNCVSSSSMQSLDNLKMKNSNINNFIFKGFILPSKLSRYQFIFHDLIFFNSSQTLPFF